MNVPIESQLAIWSKWKVKQCLPIETYWQLVPIETNRQLVLMGTHCFTFHVPQIANWY